MRRFLPFLFAIVLATAAGCSDPDRASSQGNSGGTVAATGRSEQAAQVTFTGGYETDERDHGRPVVLIAAGLGVTPEVFREAFSGVTPSRNGPPSGAEARANKKALMDALGKHGVTNERLDEVSDHYRYRREAGEMWRHTPAMATAVIEGGKVTSFNITHAGSGYTTAPAIQVSGHAGLDAKATIEFSSDFAKNGRVASITIVDSEDAPDQSPSTPSAAATTAADSLSLERQDGVRKIYPILQAYDWSHKDVAAFKHFHDLDKPPVPLITFCYDDAETYKILSKAALEARGDSLDALMAEAQKNIDAYEAEWETTSDYMLTASGRDFSAEKMLCKAFVVDAQKMLNAKQVLIAAPRRTVLYAANAEMSDEQMEEFRVLLAHTLADESYGNELISPLAFRYEDGELVGAVVLSEKADD